MPTIQLQSGNLQARQILGSLAAFRPLTQDDSVWSVSEHCAAVLSAHGILYDTVTITVEAGGGE